MNPEISIILATYNRADILPRAVESVIQQTLKRWELVVVDDGSIDNTMTIMGGYAYDARIRYIPRKHCGQSPAKNFGAQEATAPLITFLDSDDYYLPEHLEKQIFYTNQTPATTLWHSNTIIIGDRLATDMRNVTKKIDLDECVIGSTFFIKKKDFFRFSGFPSMQIANDYFFAQKIVQAKELIRISPHRTYVYDRTREDSVSKRFAKNLSGTT